MNPVTPQLPYPQDSSALGIFLAVCLAISMGWILRYVFQENTKREERLAGIVENHLALLQKLVNELNANVEESNRIRQAEHVKIIEILNNMMREQRA